MLLVKTFSFIWFTAGLGEKKTSKLHAKVNFEKDPRSIHTSSNVLHLPEDIMDLWVVSEERRCLDKCSAMLFGIFLWKCFHLWWGLCGRVFSLVRVLLCVSISTPLRGASGGLQLLLMCVLLTSLMNLPLFGSAALLGLQDSLPLWF